MPKYNGHRNWNHWNVSLWFGNDEGLYNLAREHVRRSPNKDIATDRILADLKEMGLSKTPDGAPYTKTTVRAAITGDF